MGSVSVTDVEVTDTETVIIDSTLVDADKDKTFVVSNGDNAIEAKAYSSANGTDWSLKDTKTIGSNESGTLKVMSNMYIYVKLTGRCLSSGRTSKVDATLDW